jgi:hypothetical protein
VNGDVVRGLDDPAGGTFDAAGDFDGLLPLALSLPPPPADAYRLLRYVDPDRNTIFNAYQMDDLLRDLDIADGLVRTPQQRRSLDRVRVMAHRCKDGVDLYLWFVGD